MDQGSSFRNVMQCYPHTQCTAHSCSRMGFTDVELCSKLRWPAPDTCSRNRCSGKVHTLLCASGPSGPPACACCDPDLLLSLRASALASSPPRTPPAHLPASTQCMRRRPRSCADESSQIAWTSQIHIIRTAGKGVSCRVKNSSCMRRCALG
jgi:hypothetical protein